MDGGERFFFVAVVVVQEGRHEGLLIEMGVEDVHVEVRVGLSSVGGICCLGRRCEEAGGRGGWLDGRGRLEGRLDGIVQVGLGMANGSGSGGLARINTDLDRAIDILLVRSRGKHLTRRGHGGHHLLGNVLGGRFGPRDGARLAEVGRVDHARKRWRGGVRLVEIARVGQPVQSVGLLQELVDVLAGGIPRGDVARFGPNVGDAGGADVAAEDRD
mmetsp:Transcript_29852/g.87110  ORF Transcript_29852/g.87110 Transcript_29852/m.87110 type:complete len:215 (-) Transcript_29852:987-1631(-)